MTEAFQNHPVYFFMAIIATVLFVGQMALMLMGGDTGEFDSIDLEGASHVTGGESFTLVSVQSILAFLMGTGWVGLAANMEWKWGQWGSLGIAVLFGSLMACLSAFLSMKMKGLKTVKKQNPREAVGKSGRAYTDIPAKGEGIGQVEITISEKQQIVQAMGINEKINSFSPVKVVDIDDSGNLIVEKL